MNGIQRTDECRIKMKYDQEYVHEWKKSGSSFEWHDTLERLIHALKSIIDQLNRVKDFFNHLE